MALRETEILTKGRRMPKASICARGTTRRADSTVRSSSKCGGTGVSTELLRVSLLIFFGNSLQSRGHRETANKFGV